MQLLLHAMSGRALSRTACRRMRRLSLTTSVWLHPPPSPPPPHAALGLAARRLHLRAALRAPDSAESQLSSLLAQHTVHLLPVQSGPTHLPSISPHPLLASLCSSPSHLSLLVVYAFCSLPRWGWSCSQSLRQRQPLAALVDAAALRVPRAPAPPAARRRQQQAGLRRIPHTRRRRPPPYHVPGSGNQAFLHRTAWPLWLLLLIAAFHLPPAGVLDTFFGLPSRSSAQRASAAQSLLFAARTELRALCLLRLIAHATEWPQLVAVNDAALSSPLPHAVEGEAGELRFDCLLLTQPPHGSHPQQLQQPHSPAHPALIAFHDVLSAEGLSVALQQAGIRVNGGAVWAVRVGGSWYSVRLMHDLHRLARLTNARVDRSPPVPV